MPTETRPQASQAQIALLRQIASSRPCDRLRGNKPTTIRVCADKGWTTSDRNGFVVLTDAGREQITGLVRVQTGPYRSEWRREARHG